jgi:hypothetical protein
LNRTELHNVGLNVDSSARIDIDHIDRVVMRELRLIGGHGRAVSITDAILYVCIDDNVFFFVILC